MLPLHSALAAMRSRKPAVSTARQPQPDYHALRRFRRCALFVLVLGGFLIIAHGAGNAPAGTAQPRRVEAQAGRSTGSSQSGQGAGNTHSGRTGAAAPAFCFNPLDASCWLQNAADWIAGQGMGALQPVVGDILDGNIVTQTPPDDTYNNGTLLTWWDGFLSVVDLALACLIVIGGYNVIVGRYLGLRHSELAEFLPRLILAFAAAHFSMYFLGFFIDLENALCGVALGLAGSSILSNLIIAVFQGNLAGEGLLVWILGIVLGVMVILLGVQMAVRLALLWVLLALAGPGLACFALSQTVGYGRLWLSLTASTVMVQFFQVVALSLGGTLITAFGVSSIFGIGGTLATLLVCIALLYLVLRIPGIVNHHALRPMMDASAATVGAATGTVEYLANVAPRLLALL